MKKLSQNLLDLFKAMLNHDAGLTTTECNGALSNNLLTRCVRKVLAFSLNFPSWETLTKSFDHSSLSFALAANPRSRSLFGIWSDVLLISMFIREDPILAATITVGLMKNLRSADSGDFKLKYKNSNIGLSDFKTDLGCFSQKSILFTMLGKIKTARLATTILSTHLVAQNAIGKVVLPVKVS